mmetsp:Transcript_36380/g.90760  ORF Transcript_36380/g.90760 Transcript_36380/m.90760 type:complete len:208 (-) Transcript_36380:996-1619(-)
MRLKMPPTAARSDCGRPCPPPSCQKSSRSLWRACAARRRSAQGRLDRRGQTPSPSRRRRRRRPVCGRPSHGALRPPRVRRRTCRSRRAARVGTPHRRERRCPPAAARPPAAAARRAPPRAPRPRTARAQRSGQTPPRPRRAFGGIRPQRLASTAAGAVRRRRRRGPVAGATASAPPSRRLPVPRPPPWPRARAPQRCAGRRGCPRRR